MLRKGAGGEVSVVRRSKEEDSFPRASGKFCFRLEYAQSGAIGKVGKGARIRFGKIERLIRPGSCSARI